ncbi:cysteine--tRNA ligase [Candidatus Kaiserbacteria bacterium RIFCSPHIGHO2_02_FULL_50_50]|uniref:Cysteine--tRNA ligase n=1 Tax=Candidatus Kaiserbacteria bacterium RIFCSPHIGHO2_02_FULL_50_50 TaxID=1798492 RepID=A0A1F6DCL8_9BACT|nr:MAG: cysteine--tRNA ligase [Candidatus Kaiserbacteria bacterium RIFCSPHIGHO2_02_FULL_50_50]OGG89324.1 MAG: cysteine--tRNA ligase [Candidatus Kaiserbacteria bacterium RIFCSPLOWO2_12_FULL_50_10]
MMLFDSATREKKLFAPLKEKTLSMYSCGPTVYDHAHIGNLRAYIVPDLLRRLFTDLGYTVKNTINFTDFGHLTDDADAGEDKMMKALKRHEKPLTLEAMREVAQIYIDSFKKDYERFGNIAPSNWTPASQYVHQQIQLVRTLLEKGYAYETPDGVYFDVTTFPTYGKLGNIDIEKLKEGARVEVNPWKRHPADFALWKKGLLGWESAWGKGFPGWHIECTAMAFDTLGKQIDIHTGGEDLMYTHHNGEIAQAEAITHKQYVGTWMHNAHISIEGQKISKSLGNSVTIDDVEKRGFTGLDVRYLFLTSHYRSPANFTGEALESAAKARAKLARFVHTHRNDDAVVDDVWLEKIRAALRDDLDSPKAIALLFTMLAESDRSDAVKASTLIATDALLGIGITRSEEDEVMAPLPPEIQTLVDERAAARAKKDWVASDRIRDALLAQGYIVTDTASGQNIARNI